jgi:SAM-dependent methyltransferase
LPFWFCLFTFAFFTFYFSFMPLDVKEIWNACGEAFDRYTNAADSFSDNLERPSIKQLIGDISGARVLDLGCGSGKYSLWFAELGAQVTGLDLSQTMITLAQDKARERNVQADFRVADIREGLPVRKDEFDLVFTGTALHYVEDIDAAMKQVARGMKPEARFVASVLHPMSTALFPASESEEIEGPNPWDGWYFGSPKRCIETPWLGFGEVSSKGRRVFCHHHTVSDYFNAVSSAGLTITSLLEPAPGAEFGAKNAARYFQAMHVPVFLIFKAERIR